ncbi:winged helix-turn-helix domain-containing protein [Roseateles sp.]|uniref:winged helix-turn-helix domain-containing protein n=1 Tax=Roseateles sp. TaxID=1971397 RepID=UPI0025FE021A|nr:winged helix-turn-helix domain-containing protein [Roseateles sp.]MBV8035931.1 winged helix-turn-helix domain-containing protein [Roseateles sp.]
MGLDLTPDGLPTWQDAPLFLPPKESAVLALMIRAQPLAVSKADIVQYAWGGSAVSDDSLARCISQLRRALPDVKIESVYGFGYRIVQPEPAVAVHSRLQAVVKASPDVVEAYLHAWELAQHGTPRTMGRALTVLRAISTAYPEYVPARVSLAAIIGTAVGWGMGAELGVTVAEARAELDAAERHDAGASGLRTARAWLADMDWRFGDAEQLFRAAYREQPDDAELLPLFGWHLLATGRSGEAVEVLRRAVALRPFAVYPRVMLSRALGYAGQVEAALREASRAELDHPDSAIAIGQRLLLRAGHRPDPELAGLSLQLLARADAPSYVRATQPYVLARCGEAELALALIDAALGGEQAGAASHVLFAPALAVLGQLDRAAGLVEAAFETRCGLLPLLLNAPLQVLADHPGVQRLQALFKWRAAPGRP